MRFMGLNWSYVRHVHCFIGCLNMFIVHSSFLLHNHVIISVY